MGKGEENICGWRHDKVDKKKVVFQNQILILNHFDINIRN
jgi:hypothetical protein